MTTALLLTAFFASGMASASREVRVRVGDEPHVMAVPAASAAYVVDSDLADVSVSNDVVRIRGRRPGTTILSVVAADAVLNYDLVVIAPSSSRVRSSHLATSASGGVEIDYSSETGRLTSTISAMSRSGANLTRATVTSATRAFPSTTDIRTSLPSATIDIHRGTHQITLLDQHVNSSALLRGGRNVRGVHYRWNGVELHGGLISTILYRNLLLSPASSDRLFTGRYQFRAGRLHVAPHVTWHAAAGSAGGNGNIIPSIQFKPAGKEGNLLLSGELGYNHGLAVAGDAVFHSARHDFRMAGDHTSSRFAVPTGGQPQGSSIHGELSTRLTPDVSLSLNVDGARRILRASVQRTAFSDAQLKFRVNQRWAISGGFSASMFDDNLSQLTRFTIPLSLFWNRPHVGASGVVRYQQNTNQSRGSLGGRASVYARSSRFRFSTSADYQRDGASIDLVFRDAPELQPLISELGIAVRTPEDLLALLQSSEYPALSEYLQSSALNLNPWLVRLRAEAAWDGGSAWGSVQASAMSERTASTTSMRDQMLTTLAYTRPLPGNFAVRASGTWALAQPARGHPRGWNYGVGIRVGFSGSGGLSSIFRRQIIRGRVLLDGLDASASAEPTPTRVVVVLDGHREVLTDTSGHFTFTDVSAGTHRIEAVLPPVPGLRFTTAPIVQAAAGEFVTFGLERAAARIYGFVNDDVNGPLNNVRMMLTCGERRTQVLTDASGRFAMDAPEGECIIEPDSASLPAGYSGASAGPAPVHLTVTRPIRLEYVFPAMRSIVGILPDGDGAPGVTLSSGDTEWIGEIDDAGRFAFRKLKPGAYTLTARVGSRVIVNHVEVPAAPGVIDLDLRRK